MEEDVVLDSDAADRKYFAEELVETGRVVDIGALVWTDVF